MLRISLYRPQHHSKRGMAKCLCASCVLFFFPVLFFLPSLQTVQDTSGHQTNLESTQFQGQKQAYFQ